ncbi:MAG TPA: peptidylprolyl isomerase [Kofleriaceae bacterium]
MRRQGASIFVYLIFCLLIAIFVINFRPGQSQQSDTGCMGENNQILTVDGHSVTQTAYHVAYSTPYNRGTDKQRKWIALERLIRRELLAQAASSRNLLVNTGLVEDEIKQGHFFYGGDRLQIPGIFDEDGLWSYQAFKNWYSGLNVSKNSYEVEQQRSLLAAIMGDLIKGSVQVSRDEAFKQYLYDNTLAKYDVVEFDPDEYRSAMKLTDADLDRFASEHGKEIEDEYTHNKERAYTVKKELKLREIFVAGTKPEPAGSGSATGSGSGSGEGSGSAAKPAGPTIDEAKAELEAARGTIAAGKRKFADAAKDLASDPATRTNGGDQGWVSSENPALGDKAINDAVKALKPGEMTPVVTTDKGAYLVMCDDTREGALKLEQVKHEIAEKLAKDVWSKEGAKRAALKALAATAGDKKLADLFHRDDSVEPYIPPTELKQRMKQILDLLRSGKIPDEMRQPAQEQLFQLEQMLQLQRHQIMALAETAVKDEPASWDADQDADEQPGGGGGGSGSATGSGSAAGSGSATGSGSGSAAGSGSGSGGSTPAPPPVDPLAPSKDVLPSFGDFAPKVKLQGPAPRMMTMPGVGKSKDVADALFDELGPNQVGKKVYVIGDKYVLVQLVDKTQPKVTDFDKEAAADISELREARAGEALDTWLKDSCEALAKDGKIKVNPELLRETDDKGNPVQSAYRPCISFH